VAEVLGAITRRGGSLSSDVHLANLNLVGANLHKGEISRQHQEKNNPSSSFLLLEENVNFSSETLVFTESL
jgi:hypothetical protein